jgi:DDE superfamily endonuclease
VEGASGDDRSEAACLHRRDLGENQYDAHPRPMRQRRAPHRQGPAGQVEDGDVPRRLAQRPAHRALRHRRADQWRKLPRLCRAGSPPDPRAPGDIVVMDNLGSHKGRAVRAAIRAAKAKLFFLPAYSPDLNPIEQVFAKMKTRPCCARPTPDRSKTHGEPSARCLTASPQQNAQTTSAMQDTLQPKQIAL